MSDITQRLNELPRTSGVYFYKNAAGETIYIGKAAVLSSRVRQYFQKSRLRDPKTDALVAEIADVSWTETETELDALFLEAELIRRYMPKYNILLRDDKSLSYVRISYRDNHPTVSLTRRPLDDGAEYFGPYFSNVTVRRALKYLRKAFPYSTHVGAVPKRDCLQVHLGLCPGLETGKTTLQVYRKNLKQLMRYLRGERTLLMRQIEADMKVAAKAQQYEQAATLRNQLYTLKQLGKQIIFSDKEAMDMSKDEALAGLALIFRLDKPPRRIEGYDISHMQGTDTVASMVVFVSGVPEKSAYRKFKMRLPGNDDFAHMAEVIRRRLSKTKEKTWGTPSLCVIDGGKGQLTAAIAARDEQGSVVPMIGLAKRHEDIIVHNEKSHLRVDVAALRELGGFAHVSETYTVISLPKSSHIIKLLQRIRDESHRFAVSYHSTLKQKRSVASVLDDIPGIGPITKKKLLKSFGSVRAITQADETAVAAIIGQEKAATLRRYLKY